MNPTPQLRVRHSLTELQDQYRAGNKEPLEDLWRAWKAIKELPADDPRSFFTLGGYHGEPFRGLGQTNPQYWGGYCHHGNVLFPTWHRVYLLKLEDALRSVPVLRVTDLAHGGVVPVEAASGVNEPRSVVPGGAVGGRGVVMMVRVTRAGSLGWFRRSRIGRWPRRRGSCRRRRRR
jgi:Common central domain of tyrosinase